MTESQEVYFECPKCKSLYSMPQREYVDRKLATTSSATFFLGKLGTGLAREPKCEKCGARVHRISEQEFEELMRQEPTGKD